MTAKNMYWVTMTDKFLSGWGCAKDKINKLVMSCDTFEEAEIVAENAHNRSDMRYINIVYSKPYYNKQHYFTSYHGKTEVDYEHWFIKDWFKNG